MAVVSVGLQKTPSCLSLMMAGWCVSIKITSKNLCFPSSPTQYELRTSRFGKWRANAPRRCAACSWPWRSGDTSLGWLTLHVNLTTKSTTADTGTDEDNTLLGLVSRGEQHRDVLDARCELTGSRRHCAIRACRNMCGRASFGFFQVSRT